MDHRTQSFIMPTMRDKDKARSIREKSDVLGIQYLRGIAAIMVVVHHLSYQTYQMDGSLLLENAKTGVDIFFVISGFIMIVSTDAGRRISASRFLTKRLVRITPLYWAMTAATVMVLLVLPQAFQTTVFDGTHALASFLFIATANPGNPGFYAPLIVPGWTLCLEMFFYLCFAAGLAAKRTGGRLVATVSVPILLLVTVGIVHPQAGMIGFYTKPIILEFVYGMVLGILYLRTTIVLPTLAAAAMAIGLLAVIMIIHPGTNGHWLLVGLLATGIVAAIAFSRPPMVRWLHAIGDSSYSLYLSHFILVSALAQGWRLGGFSTLLPSWTLYLVGVPLCVAGGLLCWLLVEQPLNKLVLKAVSAKPQPNLPMWARRS